MCFQCIISETFITWDEITFLCCTVGISLWLLWQLSAYHVSKLHSGRAITIRIQCIQRSILNDRTYSQSSQTNAHVTNTHLCYCFYFSVQSSCSGTNPNVPWGLSADCYPVAFCWGSWGCQDNTASKRVSDWTVWTSWREFFFWKAYVLSKKKTSDLLCALMNILTSNHLHHFVMSAVCPLCVYISLTFCSVLKKDTGL